MILTQQDLDEFIDEYSDYQLDYGGSRRVKPMDLNEDAEVRFHRWLADNPQVLMASGFQEYVGAHDLPLYRRLVSDRFLTDFARPAFRSYSGDWQVLSYIPHHRNLPWDSYSLEALVSQNNIPDSEDATDSDAGLMELPCANEIIRRASKYVGNPLCDCTTFVSPKIWTPGNQSLQKELLSSTSRLILGEIQQERRELDSIHWRVFEEIVAEILRNQGLEISVIRDHPQGGRDIVARGLIGTELVVMAVEVKHRKRVNRPEIQAAMGQNKNFAALMFVTSGEFSAGVIREASLPENRYRLFLRDGLAIRRLIRAYRL